MITGIMQNSAGFLYAYNGIAAGISAASTNGAVTQNTVVNTYVKWPPSGGLIQSVNSPGYCLDVTSTTAGGIIVWQPCVAVTMSQNWIACSRLPCTVNCLPGAYATTISGSATCLLCPAGTYSSVSGVTACLTCPVGTFAALGSTSCNQTWSGYLQNDYNPTLCLQPAGAGTTGQLFVLAACNS